MIPRRSLAVIAIAAICFVALSAFKAYNSPLGQLILFLLTVPYLASIAASVVEPFRGWRAYGLRSLIPLAACAAAWYGSMPVGGMLQSHLFSNNLPRFQAIADGIKPEALPADGKSELIPISADDANHVHRVFAYRSIAGVIVVEFLTEHGFPAKHSGYVFSSSGSLPTDAKFHYRWPYADEVRPRWFRVSN